MQATLQKRTLLKLMPYLTSSRISELLMCSAVQAPLLTCQVMEPVTVIDINLIKCEYLQNSTT